MASTIANTKPNTLGYDGVPRWLRLRLTVSQVGHNERLKTLANPNNTNLYLSNLPKSMNEAVCACVVDRLLAADVAS